MPDGEHELWPEQNGNLSWGKPKPNLRAVVLKKKKKILKHRKKYCVIFFVVNE